MRSHISSLFVVGLLGCSAARTSAVSEPPAAHAQAPLPFIENDYPRALAEAKAKGLPLFVDTWAPWCHTCRSMRAYVFTDAALAKHAGRFVWVEINTDLPESAAFQEKFPIESWPTFFIIEPKEEKALVRFAGSATVPQLEKIFEDGERAFRGGAAGPEALLARGDALYGEGKAAEAADVLAQALTEAPADWSRRGRALESLLTAQYGAKRHEACARTALAELPRVPHSASWANAAGLGLACVLQVPAGTQGAKELTASLEAKGREALSPDITMPADDRSGVYELLVEARDQSGDAPGAKALAEQWLSFLEGEAAKAPTPDARSVFDSHRMAAALVLGDPMRVVPAIEQSEKDLPGDYNPPARLANLYRKLGRLDDALAASTRALSKVQGGRKLRVFSERAEIHLARGERDAAVRTLEDALAYAKTLSGAQASPRTVSALEKKLADVKSK
ncbi:thioredoxin family protein [Vitiosangium sp. GDMCC 1.1324]|uniref:thioredoxin family protein n=1 Tax=Vitiosangium sp. (strain GDMCC 1.1324) TaxID=2138576 RepID=UPI000D36C64C|nr:thioredoxin family protein [Vitiosangium sp. GDMCC 1.1324]PTL83087.1 thiol reductase thioredoxin [Vitiosangium sp. GDMCC 1.1324]